MGDGKIAFSFGIGEDGSPGASNVQLASLLFRDLGSLRKPLVVQWEIADALATIHAQSLRSDAVVFESEFEASHVAQPAILAHRLARASGGKPDECAAFVFSELDRATRAEVLRVRTLDEGRMASALARGFNGVLVKRGFSARYQTRVPVSEQPVLTPLEKPGKGEETRRLPSTATRTLARGQERRLNRLILEAIFCDTLGTRTTYLSTTNVCTQALTAHPEVTRWQVFAHPHHQARCEDTLARVAASVGLRVKTIRANCDAVDYDPSSAQSWTRSESAYLRYEEALSMR